MTTKQPNNIIQSNKQMKGREWKMTTYTVKFTGRTNGAIGIFYPITETVQAENEEAAKLKLYEKYEHITNIQIKKAK